MKRVFVLSVVLALTACTQSEKDFHRQLYVFGTLVDIQAYSTQEQAFSEAVTEIQQRFQVMHNQWHAWKGDGLLMRFNRAVARGQCIPRDEELAALLKMAQQYQHQSQGLFNPAIGRLVEMWGFHSDTFPIHQPPPSQEEIQAWLRQKPSLDDLQFKDEKLCSDNPNLALDLGGFAKGLAVDEALEILARHGIHDAIVNAGGDLRVRGRHGQRNWRVAVRDPSSGEPLLTLEAEDGEAIFTSGNYYRFLAHQGKRYAHILDPRTGYPVDEIQSATVIAASGALADAAATALVVAGAKSWQQVAGGLGLDQVMLVAEDGTVYLTPAMKRRIHYLRQPSKEKVLDLGVQN